MNTNSYICNFIKNNPDDWRDKLNSLEIKIKDQDELSIFNYTLFGADFFNPVVQEARGIIINTKALDVVCWPFRKFGNSFEEYVDEIDWKTAKVQEKVDGSICKLFYYNNDWHWATNGMIDANVAENDMRVSFMSMIKDTKNFKDIDYSKLDKNTTYIFELVHPLQQIVVKYEDAMLYHIGTRNNITGLESNEDIGIQKPAVYEVNTFEKCLDLASKLNTNGTVEKEGFVVVDDNYHRIKIKSPEYMQLHHTISNVTLSKRKVIELILSDDIDINKVKEEFIKHKPIIEFYEAEIKNLFKTSREVIEFTKRKFEELNGDRKALFFEIKDLPYRNVGLWGLKHPNESIASFWEINKLVKELPDYNLNNIIEEINEINL